MAMDLNQKISMYVEKYGVETLNKIVERHELSTEKRMWFTIRFGSEDPEEQKQCTEKMEQLTKQIDLLDREIESKGVPKKSRPQMVKDLKKFSPDGWFSGFVLED